MSGYGARRIFFSYSGAALAISFCPIFYGHEQLARLYSRQAENMGRGAATRREKTQERYARLLLENSRMSGGFLENGADIGNIRRRPARKPEMFSTCVLYEPNRDVHGELANRLVGQRTPFRDEMWPTDDVPGQRIHAAMIHVLDHLLDRSRSLAKLRDKLEDTAVALVVTHNAASPLARILVDAGRLLPSNILNSIRRDRSRPCFERCNFDIVRIHRP